MNVEVGQTAERSLTVTREMVEQFAAISGDRNPLHFDEAWTGRTRFKRLMAQGGITASITNALVAMDMPGPGSVFMEQHWTYPAPVYIGDTITATATVKWAHASKPIATLEFVVRNQDGVDVMSGEATVYQAAPED